MLKQRKKKRKRETKKRQFHEQCKIHDGKERKKKTDSENQYLFIRNKNDEILGEI